MSAPPRVVLITRPTPYEMLLARHATREQARFFLELRGQRVEALEDEHERFDAARRSVLGAVPSAWRSARVGRDDLDRFLFEPEDVVVALGPDGLVANVAKYLDGQVVIGLNPEPEAYAGILVRHDPADVHELLAAAIEPDAPVDTRTLAECRLDVRGASERQMSSGMIVATGTGATGWASSICRGLRHPPGLPAPAEPALTFLVREPFESPTTGVGLTAGVLAGSEALAVTSEMDADGVIFGDGIEGDRIAFGYGMRAEVRVAGERLRLLT